MATDAFLITGKIAVDYGSAASELTSLSSTAKKTADALDDTEDSADDAGESIQEAGDSTETADGQFSSWAVTLGNLASQAITAVVSKCAELGQQIMELGMETETSFAQLETIAGSENIDALTDSISDLSKETGVSSSELAQVAYNAISAGSSAEDAMDMVTAATKLGVAGFTDADSALSVLSTAMNSYGDACGTAEEISDSLIQVQNLGVTTIGELSTSMGKAIATGSAYSVNLGNLESAYVSITKAGISTEESTTYLNSMLNELGDSGSNVSAILQEQTGESFTQLMEDGYSLGDVLGVLYDSCEGDSTALMNLWGSAEAGKASNAIVNQGLTEFNENLQTITSSSGATEDAYATMADTTATKIEILKANFEDLGLRIYDSLNEPLGEILEIVTDSVIPSLESLVDSLTPVITGLVTDLIPPLLDLITSVLPLACDLIAAIITPLSEIISSIIPVAVDLLSAIMPIVVTIVESVLPVASSLITGVFSALQPILNVLGPLIGMLLGVLTPILNLLQPIIDLVVASITPLLSLVSAILTPIIGLIAMILTPLTTLISAILTPIINVLTTLINLVLSPITEMLNIFTGSLLPDTTDSLTVVSTVMNDTVRPILEAISSIIKDKLNVAFTAIGTVVKQALTVVRTQWQAVQTAITPIINRIASVVTNVFTGIRTTVTNVIDNVKSVISTGLSAARDVISSVLGGILSNFGGVFTNVSETVRTAIDRIKGFFNFSVALPNIKLPHFSITPDGWKIGDLLQGSIPKLGIEWYAKAMDEGMVMNSPTVFGVNGTSLMAGGEAGSETVVGTESLMSMIRTAVDRQNEDIIRVLESILDVLTDSVKDGGSDIVIPVYIGNERLDEILIKSKQRMSKRSGGMSYA